MPPRILMIDDDVQDGLLLERHLQKHAFVLHHTHDPKVGLSMAKLLHPDAIVLDVMMPEMNGFQVCRALKADPETKDIPVILLTDWNTARGQFLGESVGADAYVPKSEDWDAVMSVLQQYCQTGGAHG